MSKALDVGTAFIVRAEETKDGIKFSQFRDAFYRLVPSTPIAAKIMEKGLQNLSYFKDTDGSFIIVGDDAIAKAIERNQSALRPLFRGVLSPREPDARRVLKFILSKLVGTPEVKGDLLVYSIPAEPIDQSDENFNTGYHEDCLKKDLSDLGWTAKSLNEAEAICYSELENDNYTGITMSYGSGMCNVCVMSSGEAIIKYSTVRAGDWLDRMAAQSTGQPDSIVQAEKENGSFIVGEDNKNPILAAISTYYVRLIDYTIQHLVNRLTKYNDLPRFTEPIPIIISGGTSLAKGFIETFNKQLAQVKLPIQVKEVRYAADQLKSVARGCLIYSLLGT